jgi:hypothetical protein
LFRSALVGRGSGRNLDRSRGGAYVQVDEVGLSDVGSDELGSELDTEQEEGKIARSLLSQRLLRGQDVTASGAAEEGPSSRADQESRKEGIVSVSLHSTGG